MRLFCHTSGSRAKKNKKLLGSQDQLPCWKEEYVSKKHGSGKACSSSPPLFYLFFLSLAKDKCMLIFLDDLGFYDYLQPMEGVLVMFTIKYQHVFPRSAATGFQEISPFFLILMVYGDRLWFEGPCLHGGGNHTIMELGPRLGVPFVHDFSPLSWAHTLTQSALDVGDVHRYTRFPHASSPLQNRPWLSWDMGKSSSESTRTTSRED